jgi:hypothetical protein
MRRHGLLSAVIAVLSLVVSGCSNSPTSPSITSVTLHGAAFGQSPASTSSAGGLQAMSVPSAGRVTVTVQENPSITTTISGNGTFELEGLPAGSFTLVFSSNGVTLGTITITSVPNQAEINVIVQITTTTVILVKVEINGTDTTHDATKTCLINGGRVDAGIELEGSVSSVSGTSFEMAVNGQRASGPVTVDTSGASFSCAGVKGTCDATLLKTDARVHVRGTLTSCSMAAAQVKATEVKFQH